MQLQFQTNVPLAPNAVITSPWIDNGEQYVRITSYSDQPGSLVLYQADSPSGLLNAQTTVDQVAASGGVLAAIEQVVTAQYWQFVYTNGPGAQTVFQLMAFASPDLTLAILGQYRRVNRQLLSMRGQYDSTLGEG